MTAQTAEAFFHAHAGVSYNPATETPEGRRRVAVRLAAAEAYAEEHGWEVRWEDDWEIQDHVAEYDGYDHEPNTCEMANLVGDDGTVLASLACIDDADDNYRRVVAAELALEAMGRPYRMTLTFHAASDQEAQGLRDALADAIEASDALPEFPNYTLTPVRRA